MENIYVQFEGMIYQQLVGHKLCSAHSGFVFIFLWEGFYVLPLQIETVLDMFNDTSRYLDNIFTIDNPDFEKHIPDTCPTELQLNKANTTDKEISFIDLNIKVIGSDVHTSFYDKRNAFGFPFVNFPWLSCDVPRLPSYGVYISQLVRFVLF